MKSGHLLRVITVLTLIAMLIPSDRASALAADAIPPADMFQLPWEQGSSWVALDGFDNGFKRLFNSPHFYLNGGAVDFAPHNNTRVGEDTSNYWVTAAAAGTVVELSNCHLKIDHGNGWITEYQFLANIQVKLGEAVYRNEHLAVIADGLRQPFCPPALEPDIPHLHFSLRPNMRGATFSGWTINYIPYLNKTTFTKGDQTLTSYQPLLNQPDLQIALRDPITWDIVYIGNVDATRYERWPFVLSEDTSFTLTATPTMNGLIPLLILLDANGNEISRATGALRSAQPAGNYFVQVQPQAGNGFYNLLLQRDTSPQPAGPFVSTNLTPGSVTVGDTAIAAIDLGNVPSDGYTSVEFTCAYDVALAEVSNLAASDLFGPDPVVAVNGPQNGTFIVAIAGSNGNRATNSGAALTFSLKGLQPGQTAIECQARISKGDQVLTSLSSIASTLTIVGNTPTPGGLLAPTPTAPTPTATPTSPVSDWLTFLNSTYGFEFQYPPDAQIVDGGSDNATRINLPFAPDTNLREKYLDALVAGNANPCQSPLATSSMLQTSDTIDINDASWLKQTGGDGTAGHINTWTAYSTILGNACISFDFVLRAANPGVFTTPPPLYDEAAETAIFEQIVSTYVVLNGIPPTETPQPVTSGTLTGQVLASKPVTVNLFDVNNLLVDSIPVNADGTFSLSAPAATYTAVATASGFLNAQGSVTLTAGATSTLSTVSLPAGDIDGNSVIDQFDAMTIGMNYNTASPLAADLNNDGIINVLDLERLAANYRKSGALAWQ